jgi:hypothetical protein
MTLIQQQLGLPPVQPRNALGGFAKLLRTARA